MANTTCFTEKFIWIARRHKFRTNKAEDKIRGLAIPCVILSKLHIGVARDRQPKPNCYYNRTQDGRMEITNIKMKIDEPSTSNGRRMDKCWIGL